MAEESPICKDPLLVHLPLGSSSTIQIHCSGLRQTRGMGARVDRLEGVHQDVSGDKGWWRGVGGGGTKRSQPLPFASIGPRLFSLLIQPLGKIRYLHLPPLSDALPGELLFSP